MLILVHPPFFTMLARAQKVFAAEELKVFSGVPSNEIVGRHIHKLIQVL